MDMLYVVGVLAGLTVILYVVGMVIAAYRDV
jgi:hypothetical protein